LAASAESKPLPRAPIGPPAHLLDGRSADNVPMEGPKPRVGRPITPEQFEALTDDQLVRLLPRAYRDFFPGKDFCADGCFYLHDGTAWSFYKGGFVDE
jgi:hypothetical protein